MERLEPDAAPPPAGSRRATARCRRASARASAASISRSTVHHQAANGVRSMREIMMAPRITTHPPLMIALSMTAYMVATLNECRSDSLRLTTRASPATRSRNASPRTSKFRNWSNEAQAGDSSTDRLASTSDARRVARGRVDRTVERAGDLVRHLAFERRGESRPPPRRSDRPCGCAERTRASDAMPPVFGLPPAIQKMSGKQASACAAESALVALESLTNSTLPMRPTCSMRCARPGNDRKPVLRSRRRRARDAKRGRAGAGGVLRVVAAAQRADAAEIARARRRGLAVACETICGRRRRRARPAAALAHRDAHDAPVAGALEPVGRWRRRQSSSTPTIAVPLSALPRPAAP